jgi:hypothetical protein
MTGPSAPGGRRADGPTRQAGIAVALCLFAVLALLAPVAGLAQDPAKTPAPERLWKAFPLDPRASPSAQPVAASSPSRAESDGRPAAASRADGGGVPGVLLGLLVLLAAGATMTVLQTRRRRELSPSVRPAPRPIGPVPSVPTPGRSGRFARATARPSGARAIATAASAADPGRGASRAGGKPPAPLPAAKQAGGATPKEAPATLAPPDRARAWTAEIEWRRADDGSRFCVVARGAGTTTLAQSPPLEWPPAGPAAVQAMTDAAEKLETALVAAGWTALPPGSAWYAKRFAWKPAHAERSATPVEPAAAGAKRDADAGADQGASLPPWQRAIRIAALWALVVALAFATLQVGNGDNDSPAGKPTPSATAVQPQQDGSDGIDLTIPVLVVLGGVAIVLAIRQARRMRH